MTNAALGYSNYFISGAVTDSSHNGYLVSTNLAGPTGYPTWQTAAGVKVASVNIDSGSSTNEWDVVALFRTNLTTAALINAKFSNVSAGATDIYQTGSISAGIVTGYQQFVKILPSVIARYMQLTISDSTNPDGYLSAGLGYAGTLWTPSRNFSYGQAAGWQDDSTVQLSRGGQKYFIQSPPYRKQSFKLENLNETELWANAAELDRLCTIQGNVLFVPDPAGSHINYQSVFGTMKQSDQQVRTNMGRYSKNYEIDERL